MISYGLIKPMASSYQDGNTPRLAVIFYNMRMSLITRFMQKLFLSRLKMPIPNETSIPRRIVGRKNM